MLYLSRLQKSCMKTSLQMSSPCTQILLYQTTALSILPLSRRLSFALETRSACQMCAGPKRLPFAFQRLFQKKSKEKRSWHTLFCCSVLYRYLVRPQGPVCQKCLQVHRSAQGCQLPRLLQVLRQKDLRQQFHVQQAARICFLLRSLRHSLASSE